MGLTTQKAILHTESEEKYQLERHGRSVKDMEVFRRSSFVTSCGGVEYKSGYLIKYPLDIAWARLQALFLRSRGLYNISFPFVLKYSSRYATLKYLNAEEAMLGNLLVCSASDISTISKALFRYLVASKSLAGLESSYLGIMNTLGRRNDPLFQEGASLWPQLATTCMAESVTLIDKELSSILVVSGSKISTLKLPLNKPGINDMRFMGGLREIDYEVIGKSVNQVAIGNPIENFISDRYAAADGQEICEGIIQTAVAVGAAIASQKVKSTTGKVIINGAATTFGEKLSEVICGFVFSEDTQTDRGTENSNQADAGTSSVDTANSTSNNTNSEPCDPSSQSCPDGEEASEDEGDDDDDDDEMPNPDGDGMGGPRSLGLNLERTSSLAVGGGLIGLIAVGSDGINILNGIPALDISSKKVYSAGIAVSSPDVCAPNQHLTSDKGIQIKVQGHYDNEVNQHLTSDKGTRTLRQ